MVIHAETEHRLVSSLTDREARDLQRLLRKLLLATES
jgi:hypothetical protein